MQPYGLLKTTKDDVTVYKPIKFSIKVKNIQAKLAKLVA